jgi:hypothetical protein
VVPNQRERHDVHPTVVTAKLSADAAAKAAKIAQGALDVAERDFIV